MKEIFAAFAVILFVFGVHEFSLIQTTQFKELFLFLSGFFMLLGTFVFAESIYELITYFSKDTHDSNITS